MLLIIVDYLQIIYCFSFQFELLSYQVLLNFLVESEGAADNVSLQIALL